MGKRSANPKRIAMRQACWARGQKKKEANRKRNDELHAAKQERRANDALTETDLMWLEVKTKFKERAWQWEQDRHNSEWAKAVGRVKGKRVTFAKAVKEDPTPEANGKESKSRRKAKARA